MSISEKLKLYPVLAAVLSIEAICFWCSRIVVESTLILTHSFVIYYLRQMRVIYYDCNDVIFLFPVGRTGSC